MTDYELLGVFYLGKLLNNQETNDLLLFDSRDMLAHTVCIADSGAGKTGLGICLMEEAAIDNIPVIAIDTKGDLSSLLLRFESQSEETFLPWIDADEARRAGLSSQELAKRESAKWHDGLLNSAQDLERIKRLNACAEFSYYTPASSIGIPLAIKSYFQCPPSDIIEDVDLFKEQIRNAVTNTLLFAGLTVEPKSKEHILLSAILQSFWKQKKDVSLVELLSQIENPPVQRFGALDLEAFFPAASRHDFALQLNNALASSDFELWTEGEPISIDKLLYNASGKNKVSIISIAHLQERERMFVVTILLTELISWMRRQSGTSSLRALLFIDDACAFVPAASNPPSKGHLALLLREAQRVGLGLALSCKKASALDYGALSEVGTWFLGKLGNEGARQRVLDLISQAGSGNADFDLRQIDQELTQMPPQSFFMHNLLHNSQPLLFKTRSTLSYLRPGLSRAQLKSLKAAFAVSNSASGSANAIVHSNAYADHAAAVSPTTLPRAESMASGNANAGANENANANANENENASANAIANTSTIPKTSTISNTSAVAKIDWSSAIATGNNKSSEQSRPNVSEVIQRYASVGRNGPEEARLVYRPMLFASAQLRFSDGSTNIDCFKTLNYLFLIKPEDVPIRWEKALSANFTPDSLNKQADPKIELPSLPPCAAEVANYKKWKTDFQSWLVNNQALELFRCPLTLITSSPQETEGEFRARLRHASREKRDGLLAALTEKCRVRQAELESKLAYAERILRIELGESDALTEKNKKESKSFGNSVFQTFVGRKMPAKMMGEDARARESSNLERVGDTQEQILRHQEYADNVRNQLDGLQYEFQNQLSELKSKLDAGTQSLESINVSPVPESYKLFAFCLCWAPCFRQPDGKITAAW